jgi:hypothetical protein
MQTSTEGTLQGFTLAEYAAEHWIDHALFENVSESVENGTTQLFDPSKPHPAVWLWIHDPEMPYRTRTASHLHQNERHCIMFLFAVFASYIP